MPADLKPSSVNWQFSKSFWPFTFRVFSCRSASPPHAISMIRIGVEAGVNTHGWFRLPATPPCGSRTCSCASNGGRRVTIGNAATTDFPPPFAPRAISGRELTRMTLTKSTEAAWCRGAWKTKRHLLSRVNREIHFFNRSSAGIAPFIDWQLNIIRLTRAMFFFYI